MTDDPYQLLGLARTATADEIRTAYRKLAKKHHPDLNPGNKSAEDLFKRVSAAYDLLSDPEKRARYDRGEIDQFGAEKAPPRGYRHYADSRSGERYASAGAGAGFGAGFGAENFEDIFANIFEHRSQRAGPARGTDARYVLEADFLDAVNGATRRLSLPDGQTLDVKIPPGTSDGDVLRLRGRGQPGRPGQPTGDALIGIHLNPHPFFRREGQDIFMELPVTVAEAVLGERVNVPTPGGPVMMKLKHHADTGTEMRLRGRGVPAHGKLPAGDLYVKLRVVIGPVDERMETFFKNRTHPDFNPRAGMETEK
jgi:DnaJ-class molecular chaperone